MKYQFVAAHHAAHPLTRLCHTLGVSRSGYYAWRHRPASPRTRANARLVEQMRQLHQQMKERYGAVKVWRALLAWAWRVAAIASLGCGGNMGSWLGGSAGSAS